MGKRKLLLDNFKKLYNRYQFKIEDNLKAVDVDFAEKVYLNLCEKNKNFKKMLKACEAKEINEYQILGVVLFHSLVLSSTNIYTV